MTEQENQKNFIEPVTPTIVGIFIFKAVAQSVAGWLGLALIQRVWGKFKAWKNRKHESTAPTVSGEEPK